MSPQSCPQVNLMKTFSRLKISLPRYIWVVSSWQKSTNTVIKPSQVYLSVCPFVVVFVNQFFFKNLSLHICRKTLVLFFVWSFHFSYTSPDDSSKRLLLINIASPFFLCNRDNVANYKTSGANKNTKTRNVKCMQMGRVDWGQEPGSLGILNSLKCDLFLAWFKKMCTVLIRLVR